LGVLSFALLILAADPAPPAPILADGEKLLEDSVDSAGYQRALAIFGAIGTAPAHGRAAQAYLRLGDLESDSDKKLALYEKGKAAADAGIALDAKCAVCWYWRGADYGRWAQTRGVMQSLFALGDIRGSFQKVLEIEPKNYDAMLSLALVDQKVPGIAGGNIERAEATMRTVIAAEPHFTRAKLDLAELLVDDGRKDEANRLVQQVLDDKAPLYPHEYKKLDVPRARKLLASLP
jgi:hypothetical protein